MNTISLDFGTTNSQIAYKDKAGVIRSIEVDGDAKIPTSIYYSLADKQFFFGQKAELAYADACANAGNDFSRYSKIISRFQSHFKPTLTKAEVKPEAFSPLFGEDEQYPLTWLQMLTAFFSHFKEVAEQTVFMGESVECLRLTHPVHFPSTQLYKAAAFEAGFSCIELVAEPEAAHAAYAHSDMIPADNVLIFDMGGGTLDVCLLSKHGETWQVDHEPLRLDTAGYHIDLALVRELLPAINKFLKEELDDDSPARAHLDYRGDADLLNHIRPTLKEPLGARHREKVRFQYDLDRYDDLTFRLKDYTGGHLEQLVAQVMQPSFERLQHYVQELPEQPGCILMVGGSSRMVYIQERLKALFPTIPVYTPNGGDKAVAEGAMLTVHFTQIETDFLYRLLRAAEQGDAQAQYALGDIYQFGKGITQDYQEAVRWFHKAADNHHAAACCRLGICYDYAYGVEQSSTEAVLWYRKSAEMGYADGQCNLAICYIKGLGVNIDYIQAAEWFQKAAEQGLKDAEVQLGWLYYYGYGVEKNLKYTAHWWERAVMQGAKLQEELAEVHNQLGVMYERGDGVPACLPEAVMWYHKAAERNDPEAQFNLGRLLLNSHEAIEDAVEGIRWLRKAMEKGGHVRAAQLLGAVYFKAQDYQEVAKCYRYPAEMGDTHAQYALGLMYEYGVGVAKDKQEAIKWYCRAAENGDSEAQKRLKGLTSTFGSKLVRWFLD